MNEYLSSTTATDLQSGRQQGTDFKLTPRTIAKGVGFLLMLLFFAAPLVQCSKDSRINATGLEIAAGTGQLMGEAKKSYPIVFVLLLMPIILVVTASAKKSFWILRDVSIVGLGNVRE
ncbi:hypothetical protein FACS1894195_0220 [Bacteroidia bacterium]|nr:hypothetical protein FACS1894195_0220 [Bacteroidia bacterium]